MTNERKRTSLAWVIALFALPLWGQESSDYVLRNLDIVSIQIYDEPDLSKDLRIDGSGQVRMGLIGTIKLAGLTLEEAEAKLENTYIRERYLRDPQVTIEVRENAPLYVHVLGQVAKPGRVQLDV